MKKVQDLVEKMVDLIMTTVNENKKELDVIVELVMRENVIDSDMSKQRMLWLLCRRLIANNEAVKKKTVQNWSGKALGVLAWKLDFGNEDEAQRMYGKVKMKQDVVSKTVIGERELDGDFALRLFELRDDLHLVFAVPFISVGRGDICKAVLVQDCGRQEIVVTVKRNHDLDDVRSLVFDEKIPTCHSAISFDGASCASAPPTQHNPFKMIGQLDFSNKFVTKRIQVPELSLVQGSVPGEAAMKEGVLICRGKLKTNHTLETEAIFNSE